ncbi:hypothetical protein D3C80_1296680 [compost metagenome]
MVGETPGAIAFVNILVRPKIEIDCRRGDVNKTPDATVPCRLCQFFGRDLVGLIELAFAAPGRGFGRAVPDPITVGHQLTALFCRGLRQIKRTELGTQLTQFLPGATVTPGGMNLMARFQQPLRRITPQPAGGPGDQHPHGSSTMPASDSPAAVPISITGLPGLNRPPVTAACNAVGIDAAT